MYCNQTFLTAEHLPDEKDQHSPTRDQKSPQQDISQAMDLSRVTFQSTNNKAEGYPAPPLPANCVYLPHLMTGNFHSPLFYHNLYGRFLYPNFVEQSRLRMDYPNETGKQ